MALLTNLDVYYKLDNNVLDSTGNYNGTLHGPTYTSSGKINGCYDFDLTNDYIETAYQPTLTDFTMNAWVKADDYSSNVDEQRIYNSWITGTASIWGGLHIRNNLAYFTVDAGGSGYKEVTADISGYTGGTDWIMVTGVRNTSDGVISIYINGSWVAETSISGYTGSLAMSNDFNIGARGDATDEWFGGLIDELGVWSRMLTGVEIAALYNSGSGLSYPFGEGAAGLNLKINIGDTWKEVVSAKINIGDTWKEVSAIKINIGDTWKEV